MSTELEKRILKEIANATIPVSTEYIAKKMRIGWGTAIRHALELMVAEKLKGLKTTKSWVFWVEKTPTHASSHEVFDKQNGGEKHG